MAALGQDFSELDLNTRVRGLVRRGIVTCTPTTPIRDVFQKMYQARVGSIVVTEAERVVGIFTQNDLVPRILIPQIAQDTPVSAVMTATVHCVDADSLVIDAMVRMAHLRVRHLPVVEDGRLLGMVSERDLMAFHRTSLRSITVEITRAQRLRELRSAFQRSNELAARLLGQGLSATSLARLVSHLNDAMTRRVIEIVLAEQLSDTEPLNPWAWLALGSEGREEQTVATDQDNAIVFFGEGAIQRPRLMAIAERVNRGLDEVGFPLCKGGVMAMNEKWCRSIHEWKEEVGRWFCSPTPEHILDSHTFLDFRPVYGDVGLADGLKNWVWAEMPQHGRFLRTLAEDSLRSPPNPFPAIHAFTPLARFFRRRGLSMNWMSPQWVDIKRVGTAPVVAWARCLAFGIDARGASTDARLAGLYEKGRMQRSESQVVREAFDLVQRYRLRAQLTSEGKGNDLNLDELSLHEVRQLADAITSLAHLRHSVQLAFRI